MTMRLDGHVAIVTGAGRGIGRATALELARLGARVVVNDLGVSADGKGSDASVAQSVVAEIESLGGEAVANADSVADWDGAGRLIDTAMERFGKIDILINNAGSLSRGNIWTIEPDYFQFIVGVHIFGTFNCIRRAVPHMMERKYGRIVNFVSRGGLVGSEGVSAYGAGKGAIFGFTNVIARELQPHNILVNGVNPAATRTRMVTGTVEKAKELGLDVGRAERMLAVVQEPEEVAPVAAFLCAEELEFAGQYFFAQAGLVSLLEPIQFPKKLYKSGRWTAAELLEASRELKIAPLAKVY